MQKFFAVILLLCHMNNSMFLPQVAEDDQFDSHGRAIDDINTVVEYVDQVILGNYDDTPEDEDTDDGQNFHIVKTVDYHFQQTAIAVQFTSFTEPAKSEFSEYRLPLLTAPVYNILTPPPDKA